MHSQQWSQTTKYRGAAVTEVVPQTPAVADGRIQGNTLLHEGLYTDSGEGDRMLRFTYYSSLDKGTDVQDIPSRV